MEETQPGVAPSAHSDVPKKSKRLIVRIGQIAAVVAAFAVVFWLGLSIGSGSWLLPNRASTHNASLPDDLDYSEVESIYDKLRLSYDGTLSQDKLLDGLKSGLVQASGDPYTQYFNPRDAQSFEEELSGSFSGIGAELSKDEDGNVVVVSPIKGFPAEKAGLQSKDIIVAVDGESTSGLALDKVISKIRGKEGTDVTLKIYRNGSETKDLTITRDTITIPSVEYKVLDNGIGYIQIRQFWTDTADLVSQAAAEFEKQNVKGVVLDLRGNPGGSLDAAIGVSSVWLPDGTTVLTQKRDGKVEQTYTSSGDHPLQEVPTVVLIDGGSASASEIVAGALRDNKAATLVGEKSYGKGSVQDIIPLSNGGELKVTIARWYRPNGKNIDKKGITPDTVVKYEKNTENPDADNQLDAAIKALQ